MSDELEDNIKEELKKLVYAIGDFTDDDEDYSTCYESALQIVQGTKLADTSEKNIRSYIDEMGLKFNYEGFPKYEKLLKDTVDSYLRLNVKNENKQLQPNMKWRSICLCKELSGNPFQHEQIFSMEQQLKEAKTALGPTKNEECDDFDWVAYLNEGRREYYFSTDSENEVESDTADTDQNLALESASTASSEQRVPPLEHIIKTNEEEFLSLHYEAHESDLWLRENVQNSLWSDNVDLLPDVSLIKGNFGVAWRQILSEEKRDQKESIQLVTEYKVIRVVLCSVMLDGPSYLKCAQHITKQISVPSLTQECFSLFMSEALDVIRKYKVVSSFRKELEHHIELFPTSFLVYASEMEKLCSHFTDFVVEVEKFVKKQDSTYTLLDFCNDIRLHSALISFLYAIHTEAVSSDWSTCQPSWNAIRLLSVLYSKISTVTTIQQKNCVVRLFLNTFSVYVNIIDGWLNNGKLVDAKEEFFISKSQNSDDEIVYFAPLNFEFKERGVQLANILVDIRDILLMYGKNTKFFTMTEKSRKITCNSKSTDPLYKSFISEVRNRLEELCPCTDCSENAVQSSEKVGSFSCENSIGIEYQNLKRRYHPFLHSIIAEGFSRDAKFLECEQRTELLPKFHEENLVPLQLIIYRSFRFLVEAKVSTCVTIFYDSMFQSHQLLEHIHSLSSLLLMDLHHFVKQIRTESGSSIGHLMMPKILRECAELNNVPFADTFGFKIAKNDVILDSDPLSDISNLVDHLSLQHKIVWPVSEVITDVIVQTYYSSLFRQILKLAICRYCVACVHKQNKSLGNNWVNSDAASVKKLYIFQFWIYQFMEKFNAFILSFVYEKLFIGLTEKTLKCPDLDSMRKCFENYLEIVCKEWLIIQHVEQSLHSSLQKIYSTCIRICQLWGDSEIIINSGELRDLSHSFITSLEHILGFLDALRKQQVTKPSGAAMRFRNELQFVVKSLKKYIPVLLS